MANHPFIRAFARRWRLFLVVVLIVLTYRLAFWRPVSMLYRTEMRFIVSTQPLDSTLVTEQEKYYLWIASEYVVASVSDYMNGNDFISLVSNELLANGYDEMDAVTTDEFVQIGYERSRLVVAVTHPDREMVPIIANATAVAMLGVDTMTLVEQGTSAPVRVPIPQLEESPAFLFPIDSDLLINDIDLRADTRRVAFNIVMSATLTALVAVFVAEARDKTIRSRRSAMGLSIPLIGEIPAHGVSQSK